MSPETLRTLELGPAAEIVDRLRPARIPRAGRAELRSAGALLVAAQARADAIVTDAAVEADAMLEATRQEALERSVADRRAFEEQCSRFIDTLVARLPDLLERVVQDAIDEVLDAHPTEALVRDAIRHLLSLGLSELTASIQLPPRIDPAALGELPAAWRIDPGSSGDRRAVAIESSMGSVRVTFGADAEPAEADSGIDPEACSFLALGDPGAPPSHPQESCHVTGR